MGHFVPVCLHIQKTLLHDDALFRLWLADFSREQSPIQKHSSLEVRSWWWERERERASTLTRRLKFHGAVTQLTLNSTTEFNQSSRQCWLKIIRAVKALLAGAFWTVAACAPVGGESEFPALHWTAFVSTWSLQPANFIKLHKQSAVVGKACPFLEKRFPETTRTTSAQLDQHICICSGAAVGKCWSWWRRLAPVPLFSGPLWAFTGMNVPWSVSPCWSVNTKGGK